MPAIDESYPSHASTSAMSTDTVEAPVPSGRAAHARARGARPDPYLLVAIGVSLWAIGVVIQHTWVADFLLHAATVQAMARDLANPLDPMVGSGHGSPYYSPYILLAAAVVRIARLSPVPVFGGLALVNTGLLLWSFRRFCGWFTSSAGTAVALLATLFLWGIRPPVWSGFLSLRSLAEVLPYPSTLAFSLMLLAWDQLLRYRKQRAYWRLIVFGLLAAAITLIHSFTAMNTAIGVLAILLAYRSQWRARDLAQIAAAGLGAFILVLAWPYSSIWDLFTATPEFARIHRLLLVGLLDPHQLSCLYGIFGLVPLVLRVRANKSDPLAMMFGMSTVVIVVAASTGQYQFLRVIPVAMLSAHVALGAFVADRDVARVAWRRSTAAIAAAVLLAGLALDVTPVTGFVGALPITWLPKSMQSMARTPSLSGPSREFDFVRSYAPTGSIMFTDSRWSDRHLNWLGYYTVNPGWPDPWLKTSSQRSKDRVAFLRADTSPIVRAQILARYGARCALIARTPALASSNAIAGFRLVASPNGVNLFCR